MLSISNITLHFGGRTIFDNISFQANEGERIGLAGRNGAGKSTLMKVIAGLMENEGGQVALAGGKKLGYLEQDAEELSEGTVMEATLGGFEQIKEIEREIERINEEMASRDDYESEAYMQLIERSTTLIEQLSVLDSDKTQEEAEKILIGLGFERADLQKSLSKLSGGWKMRVVLARLLVGRPDILLLDEPTNHLDIDSIHWLERFLKNFSGVIILVSHDRHFLDSVTNRTIEISSGNIRDYKLPYTKYLEQREEEREIEERAFVNQQKQIKQTEQLIDRFRAKASKASFAQSLIKRLERMDRIELDDDSYDPMNLRFPEAPPSGRIVVEGHSVSKAYPDKNVFDRSDFVINVGEKVALVGKNGMGKTTLIKLILGREAFEGKIDIGYNVKVGYYAQDAHEHLNPEDTVFDTIDRLATGDARTKVRGILGSFLFSGDDIEKKVKVLSGGEKSRLVLCSLMLEKFNFLVLDEPTNHLDILSKEVLKEALRKFTGTLLIVSHDREFMHDLTDRTFEIHNRRVAIHHGDINDYFRRLDEREAKENTSKPEKPSSKKQEKEVPPAPKKTQKLSYREQKALKNRVSKLERDIESLEQELEELDHRIANMDFNGKDESTAALNRYQEAQSELSRKMAEWESASEDLDE